MIRWLVVWVFVSPLTCAQELVSVEVDVGGPHADLTEADLDGDGKDDLLFLIEGTPPVLDIRYQDHDGKGFGRRAQWQVPAGTAGIMVAEVISPGQDVLYLSASGASIVEGTSEDGEARPWIAAELLFPPGYRGLPKHWGWGRDIDGDGHDDVLLPGIDRDLIVFVGPDGKPKKTPTVLAHPRSRTTADRTQGLLRVRRGRPRTELARMAKGVLLPTWLDRSGLHVLPRQGDGFADAPINLFPLEDDAPSGLGLLRRVDVDLDDLDGDGLADLCLTRTEARVGTIPERRTDLLLFKNTGQPNPTPTQVIVLPGVLSSGPSLADVDGDGHVDLFLSVFAGDVKSEITRRLLGRVRLDYYLYLGTGDTQPFPRSPSHSLTDKVDTQTFETWGIRHRRILTDDWDGDGMLDLVQVHIDDGSCHVQVRHAVGSGPDLAFADSGASFSWKGEVIHYTTTAIQRGRPAVRLKTTTRVIYIMRP